MFDYRNHIFYAPDNSNAGTSGLPEDNMIWNLERTDDSGGNSVFVIKLIAVYTGGSPNFITDKTYEAAAAAHLSGKILVLYADDGFMVITNYTFDGRSIVFSSAMYDGLMESNPHYEVVIVTLSENNDVWVDQYSIPVASFNTES